jgi:Holliday junction resolvase RusA-like endonuclease
MFVDFCVPGQPVAKGRPKFARRGAHVVAYTPEKTASYESLVKMAAHQAMAGRPPSAAPIEIEVALWLQIPVSWTVKKRLAAAAGMVRATKKPDADNVLKGLKDGCNGIVWNDDAQVVTIVLQKRYAESPRVEVIVRELAGECA